MGDHHDALADVFAAHAAHFGSSSNVVLTSPSGTDSTVDAVVGPETKTDVDDSDRGGRMSKATRQVLVATADLAAVNARFTLTIDGDQYTIEDTPGIDGSYWLIEAVRYGRVEARRPDYTHER